MINWVGRISGAGLVVLGALVLTPQQVRLVYFPGKLLVLLGRSRLQDWQLELLGLAFCALGCTLVYLSTRFRT